MASAERVPLLAAACEEMTDLGIDFDLAPVADLDINPTSPGLGAAERCISADPEVVQALVADFADAARSAGLMLCLKHYPGLGSARVDSHLDLTVVDEPSGDQLGLFYDLASVIPGDAILVSHAIVPPWHPELPATMNPAALHPLRDRMPDTLLITDDMQMQGLLKARTLTEGCAAALAAGMDMVIIGNNLIRAEPDELCTLATEIERHRSGDREFAENLRLADRRINARKP
jgi:beta-N-acetylhexosaminidase